MPAINGETKLLGLLGHKTNYTLSPAMHNRAIQILGLDQVYVNFDLGPEHVATFLQMFWHLGGVGLNITKPYKTVVARLLPHCDLTSVNTLVRGPIGWQGYSTDGEGFVNGLSRLGVAFTDIQHLMILGAGGATEALVKHFGQYAADTLKKITILRRSNTNDQQLQALVPPGISIQFRDWLPEALQQIVQSDGDERSLLVHASSATASGDLLGSFVPSLAEFRGAFVDLIYDKPTALYYEALNKGLKTQDGLPMLIEQARLSQKLWWGKAIAYDEMALALKNTGRF